MHYRLIIREMTKAVHEMQIGELDYEFGRLYSLNGVAIIGVWYSLDIPKYTYSITAYRDEEHYRNFVTKRKSNDVYQRQTAFLAENTESVANIPLDFAPMMKYNFDQDVMDHYLKEVKRRLEV